MALPEPNPFKSPKSSCSSSSLSKVWLALKSIASSFYNLRESVDGLVAFSISSILCFRYEVT